MIVQARLPEAAASLDKVVVLENACGTGPIAKRLHATDILDQAAKAKLELTCADYAPNM